MTCGVAPKINFVFSVCLETRINVFRIYAVCFLGTLTITLIVLSGLHVESIDGKVALFKHGATEAYNGLR